MSNINFFCEEIDFQIENEKEVSKWIQHIIKAEKFELISLNYIFCDDEYLHKINMEYLNHDTYTDIITFDNSDYEDEVEGDIFVSIERVTENAQELGISFKDELHRVLAHGVLHLVGYDDHSDEDEAKMRNLEDKYLQLRPKEIVLQ